MIPLHGRRRARGRSRAVGYILAKNCDGERSTRATIPRPLQLSRTASLSLHSSKRAPASPVYEAEMQKKVSIAPLPFTLGALQYHMGQRFRERGDCSVTLPINTEKLHWVLF